MKRKELLLLLAFMTGILLIYQAVKKDETCYQEGIAGEIIRLHVIADSDSEADQLLKLKVKDAVVTKLRRKLENADTIEEAREVILENMDELEKTADRVIEENGFPYKAEATMGQAVFPIKRYGDLIFPAGEYEALRIELGRAEGKNWWCVMFPTLCYVDETKQEITEENKEKFKAVLTKEEYESLSKSGKNQTFYKLKAAEYFYKLIDIFPI